MSVPPPYRPRKRGGYRYRIWVQHLDPGEIDHVDGIPTTTPQRATLDVAHHGLQRHLVEQAIVTARNRQLFGRDTEMRIRHRSHGRNTIV